MIGPQPTGCIDDIVITAQSHTGLKVIARGKPARLAIVTDDGEVIVAGDLVAKEAEAVAINSYRNFLAGKGHLSRSTAVRSTPAEP